MSLVPRFVFDACQAKILVKLQRRSVFGSTDANFAWEEFSAMNGADETTAKNLNRKVSAQGTKASGQTWQLDLTVTFS